MQLPVLEMLLEHGASLEAKTRNGDTALSKMIFVLFIIRSNLMTIKTKNKTKQHYVLWKQFYKL